MKYEIKKYDKRYFIGVEYEGGLKIGEPHNIGDLWSTFLKEDILLLGELGMEFKSIGLECYPPDLMETKVFDYYALVQTPEMVKKAGFVTKKLPAGRYIRFEVEFDSLHDEIQKVYKYIKENNINVHMGFDYEDYIEDENYWKDGAKLFFSLLLEDDK